MNVTKTHTHFLALKYKQLFQSRIFSISEQNIYKEKKIYLKFKNEENGKGKMLMGNVLTY